MNEFFNTYGAWFAFISGACGVIYTFLNRDRYKAQVNDIYKPGNDELRQQLASARAEVATLTQEVAVKDANVRSLSTLVSELKDLNSRQPDFTALVSLISENHKQIMTTTNNNQTTVITKITQLGRVLAGERSK